MRLLAFQTQLRPIAIHNAIYCAAFVTARRSAQYAIRVKNANGYCALGTAASAQETFKIGVVSFLSGQAAVVVVISTPID